MPAGTCDPASVGLTEWSGAQQVGPCLIEYTYGWDGVSVRPDCIGPLTEVVVTNQSPIGVWPAATWYVHLKGRRGSPKVLDIAPGTVDRIPRGQLVSRGIIDNTDLEGMRLTDSPTPPPD